jgi:ribosomal protein S20
MRMTERFRDSEFRTAVRKVREPRIAAWTKPKKESENEERMTERFRVSEFRTAVRKVREPRIAAWRKPKKVKKRRS